MYILPGHRGTYIRGVCTFGALQPTANFIKNWRGTYFRRGTYLRGFTVIHEQIDNFVCTRSLVSCEKRFFSLNFTIFESFCQQFSFFQWQCSPTQKVSGIPSIFSKAISQWRTCTFPPDPGLSQPNSEENFEQRFSRYLFAFHPVLFIKESILTGLSLLKFTYQLQKRPVKSFTLSV